MRTFAAVVLLGLVAPSAQVTAQVLAQANANLAPGGIVDGGKATVNAAEGTAPDGRPSPGGQTGEGRQAATSGSKMVKQGDAGTRAPGAAETSKTP